MTENIVRTRFAPSPTGFMHIGNLRTALFEYLVAKSAGGNFILRIEDTDQERYVEGAVDKIYQALKITGLQHDEGPDLGGDYGPYIQSERKDIYKERIKTLLENGKAYYCFCTVERLEKLHAQQKATGSDFIGYDRHCRYLSPEEVQRKLDSGTSYVVRQAMPTEGEITYTDEVYGKLTFENATFEDQVLLKSDGYPTYNYANVIDDHDMKITHIVRGNEYLSSTPKYIHLYHAFGYEIPKFIHLPLINGKDGTKLSKRHGATSLEDLLTEGYLPEAIVNYLAMLGWSPKGTQELFTLSELEESFSVAGIAKSPATYDENKLQWYNEQYIQNLSLDEFIEVSRKYFLHVDPEMPDETMKLLAGNLQSRISKLTEIPGKIAFMAELQEFDLELLVHKKSKSTLKSSQQVLNDFASILEDTDWNNDDIKSSMVDYAEAHELKNGTVMFPIRVAITGQAVTPGGTVEVLLYLGKEESLRRLKHSLDRLNKELDKELDK